MFERLKRAEEKIKGKVQEAKNNVREAANKVKEDVRVAADKVKESTGIKQKQLAELKIAVNCNIAMTKAKHMKPLIKSLIEKITNNKSLLPDEKLRTELKQTSDSILTLLELYTEEYKKLEKTFFGFYQKLEELGSNFDYVFKTLVDLNEKIISNMLKTANNPNQDLRKNVIIAISEAAELQSEMKKIAKANLMHYATNFFPTKNDENTDKVRLEENLKSLRRYLGHIKPEFVADNLKKFQEIQKSIQGASTFDYTSFNDAIDFSENVRPVQLAIKAAVDELEKLNREIYLELDEKYISNLCKNINNMVEEYFQSNRIKTDATLKRRSSFKQLEGVTKLTEEEAAQELEMVKAAYRSSPNIG